MAWDNNYNGTTKLKDWWGKVKENFNILKSTSDDLTGRVDTLEDLIEEVSWSPKIYSDTNGNTDVTTSYNIKTARCLRVNNICFIEILAAPKTYPTPAAIGSFSLPYKLSAGSESSYPYDMWDEINARYGSGSNTPISGCANKSKALYQFASAVTPGNPAEYVTARGYYYIDLE